MCLKYYFQRFLHLLLNMEKDSVSTPSSPFNGFTEEEINVTISGTLAPPTVFVYEDVEYRVLDDEEAKNKEELYRQQDWSGLKEEETTAEKRTQSYLSGTAPLLTGTKSRQKVSIIDKYPSDLPSSHLPKNENVLLCMFQFLVEDEERQHHSNPLTVATKASIIRSAELTTPVIKTVWEHHFSDVLINNKQKKIIVDDRKIIDKLVKLFEELKTIDKESRWAERKDTENVIKRRQTFKDKLKVPFDICLKAAEDKIKMSGIANWKEDVEHLRNQLRPDQIGSVAGLDARQVKLDKRRQDREQRQEVAKEKSDKMVEAMKGVTNVDDEDEMDTSDVNSNDPLFVDPTSSRRRSKLNVMGPIALCSMARGVSERDTAIIAAAAVKACNINVEQTNISVGSSHYQRQKTRASVASNVRENFKIPQHCSLHVDGKMVKYKGSHQLINRQAIVINNIGDEKYERLIGAPGSEDGTGRAEAKAVIDVLMKYGIKCQICSISFDTTATNTSADVGCILILEDYIGRPVLWCACRHHCYELLAKDANKLLFGPTTGVGVPLFHKLAQDWQKLDVNIDHISIIDKAGMPDWMLQQIEEVLKFGEKALKEKKFARNDYLELLQLCVLYLGGTVPNFSFRLPGADHHARFMSKGIYWLKIKLLQNSFCLPLPPAKKDPKKEQKIVTWHDVTEMANFLAIFYVKFWFLAPLTTEAARNDLEFYSLLYKYQEVNTDLAETVRIN